MYFRRKKLGLLYVDHFCEAVVEDYLFRCPYPVINIVYGSSEFQISLLTLLLRRENFVQKMRMQTFGNCMKWLLDFCVSSILVYLLCMCFEH